MNRTERKILREDGFMFGHLPGTGEVLWYQDERGEPVIVGPTKMSTYELALGRLPRATAAKLLNMTLEEVAFETEKTFRYKEDWTEREKTRLFYGTTRFA